MADIRFSRLWDVYSPLLTPTQREITDMFFNLDLTVSEIAEQKEERSKIKRAIVGNRPLELPRGAQDYWQP